MIHVRTTKDSSGKLDGLHLAVTADSLSSFVSLIDRALNCWADAPKELKDLGDMITHGQITQDHTFTKINTHQQSTDHYNPAEIARISEYIEFNGQHMWLAAVADGTCHKIAKGK